MKWADKKNVNIPAIASRILTQERWTPPETPRRRISFVLFLLAAALVIGAVLATIAQNGLK